MEIKISDFTSDAEWYCRRDPEQALFYEVFFQMCRKYAIRWASADKRASLLKKSPRPLMSGNELSNWAFRYPRADLLLAHCCLTHNTEQVNETPNIALLLCPPF